ncbi:MAG: DUF1573 domain-containing protein [Eubacteriaceae bacterium]
MENFMLDQFQVMVDDLLLKHKSILDILSKQQESSSRVNRAIIKAVTSCGCIQIDSTSLNEKEDISDSIRDILDNNLSGNLCNKCREIIEQEIGNHLFYTAALCNSLDLNIADILKKELTRINTLGKYNIIR